MERIRAAFVPAAFYSSADPPANWPGDPSTVPRSVLPKTFSFLNVGRVVDQGVELSWDRYWGDAISTRASYTYQRDPEVSDRGSIPLRVNRPPRDQGSILVTVRQTRWFASSGVTYTGEAFWADVLDSRFWGTTKSYVMVDAALGIYAGGHSEITLKGTDLLDEKIKEHAFGDIIRRKVTLELRHRF